MIEKKAALVAGLIALTIIGAPIAANATTPHATTPITGISIHAEDEDDEFEDEDEDEDHDEDDEAEDEDHKGWIPPVFVVPGGHAPHKHGNRPKPPVETPTGIPGTGVDENSTSVDGASLNGVDEDDFVVVDANDPSAASELGNVNPHQDEPVAIERVSATGRTPADEFLDTAYVGMAMLGAAALGLGTTAAVRTIRLRRSGKSDYFYDEK
jgi:hypothetical protein